MPVALCTAKLAQPFRYTTKNRDELKTQIWKKSTFYCFILAVLVEMLRNSKTPPNFGQKIFLCF
jgi:hypothetical protein